MKSSDLLNVPVNELATLFRPHIVALFGDEKSKFSEYLNSFNLLHDTMQRLLIFMRFDNYNQKVEFISTVPVGTKGRMDIESNDDQYEELPGNALNPYGYEGILLNKVVEVVKGLTPLGEISCPIRVMFSKQLDNCGAIIFEGKVSVVHAICVSLCTFMKPYTERPNKNYPSTVLAAGNALTDVLPSKIRSMFP